MKKGAKTMSVIIKGIEMPKVCAECFLRGKSELFPASRPFTYKYASRCLHPIAEKKKDPWRDLTWQMENREKWCPLEEVDDEVSI